MAASRFNPTGMPTSPKGRLIQELEGEPGTIYSRGSEIQQLGEKMVRAADTLERIKDGTDGSNGKSMEQVREAVGDMCGDLRKAGTTYSGVGPVLMRYASVIGSVDGFSDDLQAKIKTVVADCETAWKAARTAQDAVPVFPGARGPQQADDDGKDYDDLVQAAEDKQNAFDEVAADFDTYYDTWEDAFEKAANDIDHFVEDGVHDGFFDNLDEFVSGALEVLKWAGLVVGVLAIIIGGPILGAIAAVVGLAVFALTVYQKLRGDASWKDLAWATIGIIPIGKLAVIAKAGKGARLTRLAEEGTGGLATTAGRTKIVQQISRTRQGWKTDRWVGLKNGYSEGDAITFPNFVSRLYTGKNLEYWEKGGDAVLNTQLSKDIDSLLRVGYDGLYKRVYKLPNSIVSTIGGAVSPDPGP